MLRIRPATLGDVYFMSSRLRGDDVRELETAMQMSARRTLYHSFAQSHLCFVGSPERDPVVMFGVGPDPRNPQLGIIWMVGTHDLAKSSRSIIRQTPEVLQSFLVLYPEGLHVLSDSRNLLHQRWLNLIGFQVLDTQDVHGVPFLHVFYR